MGDPIETEIESLEGQGKKRGLTSEKNDSTKSEIKRRATELWAALICCFYLSLLHMIGGRKAVKRDRMIGRQIEEKEGNESKRIHSNQGKRVMCPVCGKEIHEVNLPDVKSVVKDRLAWVEFVIVDSSVCLLVDCEHRFEDRDITLDNLHEFTAVVTCEFDSQGACTQFEVKEIRAKR